MVSVIIGFIGGWISGVIGIIWYAHYWIKKHTMVIKMEKTEDKENGD